MPYLNNKLTSSQHKDDCKTPSVKRLYIRDYDDNGKQKLVPYGVTCTNCGVMLITEKYKPNLSPVLREIYGKYSQKQLEKFDKIDKEYLLKYQPYQTAHGLQALLASMPVLNEWGDKLVEAGMHSDDVRGHGIRIRENRRIKRPNR